MKSLSGNYKSTKKTPMDRDEHIECAEDIRRCLDILGPWLDRFCHAYPCGGTEVRVLRRTLNLLSCGICHRQDAHWFKLEDSERGNLESPYYGNGKIAYL